jgi:hypothetical protein
LHYAIEQSVITPYVIELRVVMPIVVAPCIAALVITIDKNQRPFLQVIMIMNVC